MILEFVAALVSGLGVMGIALLLNRITGKRLGKWLAPAAVAGGMLAYTIWSEYSWAERSMATGIYSEVERDDTRVWYRPWSWLVPQTQRMIVLDRRFTRIHPEQPQLVQVRVVRLERWLPPSGFLGAFDCVAGAVAPLTEQVELREDGTLPGAVWETLSADDPLLRAACAAGEELRDEPARGA